MTIQPLTGVLIRIVCVLNPVVMVYWYLLARCEWTLHLPTGPWRG